MLRLHLLGSIDLRDEASREIRSVLARPKRIALLGYLAAARPGRMHRRASLLPLFWPELDEAHARTALRKSLHLLRRSLGGDVLLVPKGDEEIGVSREHLWCDVEAFRAAVEAGHHETALELHGRGRLMDGLAVTGAPAFDAWLDKERLLLQRQAVGAASALASEAEAAGVLHTAVRWARRASDLSPYDEPAHRRLLGALDALGDRAGAIAAHERFAGRLLDEMDLEPSPETRALVDAIRSRSDVSGPVPHPLTEPRAASQPPVVVSVPPAGDHAGTTARPRAPGAPEVGTRTLPASTRGGILRSPILRWGTGMAAVLGAVWLLDPFGIRSEGVGNALAVGTPAFLGADLDGEFVARGIQEELVAHLSAIPGVTVVAPGEVRAAESEGLEGRGLYDVVGARFGLESSLQEVNGTYRVVFTLVDGATGTTVWSTVVQPRVGGLLELRAEVAARVAAQLTLDPEGVDLAYSGATEEAMASYLQAVGLLSVEGGDDARQARWRRAEVHLLDATAQAPDFAAAYARLALLHFRQFWLGAAPDRSSVAQGERWLDRARELDGEALETRLATAYHAYYIDRDWEAAIDLARDLAVEMEHDHEVTLLWAMAERRSGDFERAAQILEARLRRHPGELTIYAGELVETYRRLGRRDDVERILEQLEERTGRENCQAEYSRLLHVDGDAAGLDALVDRCRAAGLDDFGGPPAFWHEFRMRRWEYALAAVDSVEARRRAAGVERPDWMTQQWAPFPLDLWRGAVYAQVGDEAAARTVCERHVPELEAWVRDFPKLTLRRAFLALAYACAGRDGEALREAQRAVEIAAAEGDRWAGIPGVYQYVARIHAQLGHVDDAIDLLANELTDPANPILRLGDLRVDPIWDPLRASPRFDLLLARLEARQGP